MTTTSSRSCCATQTETCNLGSGSGVGQDTLCVHPLWTMSLLKCPSAAAAAGNCLQAASRQHVQCTHWARRANRQTGFEGSAVQHSGPLGSWYCYPGSRIPAWLVLHVHTGQQPATSCVCGHCPAEHMEPVNFSHGQKVPCSCCTAAGCMPGGNAPV
jgi:hypothetical protein